MSNKCFSLALHGGAGAKRGHDYAVEIAHMSKRSARASMARQISPWERVAIRRLLLQSAFGRKIRLPV